MIAVLGARIWIEARVDFRDPVNLVTAAVALIVGAGNYTLNWGDYQFAGIALGTLAAIGTYQVLRLLRRRAVHAGAHGTWSDATVDPLAATPDPREARPARSSPPACRRPGRRRRR